MMKHASKLQEFETNIETEFYREIADEMLEGAYFDFKSLNTGQFLDKIREACASAAEGSRRGVTHRSAHEHQGPYSAGN